MMRSRATLAASRSTSSSGPPRGRARRWRRVGVVQPPCFCAEGPSSSVRLIKNPKFSVRKRHVGEKGWEVGRIADVQQPPRARREVVLMSSITPFDPSLCGADVQHPVGGRTMCGADVQHPWPLRDLGGTSRACADVQHCPAPTPAMVV